MGPATRKRFAALALLIVAGGVLVDLPRLVKLSRLEGLVSAARAIDPVQHSRMCLKLRSLTPGSGAAIELQRELDEGRNAIDLLDSTGNTTPVLPPAFRAPTRDSKVAAGDGAGSTPVMLLRLASRLLDIPPPTLRGLSVPDHLGASPASASLRARAPPLLLL